MPMFSRRTLLTGGPSLLPRAVRAQDASWTGELLSALLPRHRLPGASVALMTTNDGGRLVIAEFLGGPFDTCRPEPLRPAD